MDDDLISAVWTRRTLRRYLPVWAALLFAAAALDVVLLREAASRDAARGAVAGPAAIHAALTPSRAGTLPEATTAAGPSQPDTPGMRFGPYVVVTLHGR
ncbi:MAG TPA: hypothetical protein VIL35_08000 [Vicinamibacterales bacterium]